MVEGLLPRRVGRKGRPFSDPRQMLESILYRLRVPRTAGRPRTRLGELWANKAYASKAVRRYLREHRITASIDKLNKSPCVPYSS
jgi:hypothetical protein